MSETQFSRLDWRPSIKRASSPRKRDWGGQKKAPIAFLAAAAKNGFAFNLPRCKHCRRFAMKGTGLCRHHSGPRVAMAQGRLYVRPLRSLAYDALVSS
jgi:hypothetical protein